MDWNLVVGVASALASVISAVTAIIVVKQSQRDRDRWRDQQRETKQAEIAGEVTVAALQLLTGLGSPIALLVRGGSMERDPNDEHKNAREATEASWRNIAPVTNEFVQAWQRAEVYLDEAANGLLERIWDTRAEILANQGTFFMMPLGTATEFFNGGWGRNPREKLEALRAEVRTLLRPLAHLIGESNAAKAVKELAGDSAKPIAAPGTAGALPMPVEPPKGKQHDATKPKQIESNKPE